MKRTASGQLPGAAPVMVPGQCACGSVRLEFAYPAFWAWHDHSRATQHAHGAAYATYIGVWKSRLRIVRGAGDLARFEDKAKRTVRSFCAKCGTPLLYERAHSPRMVNLPRALFEKRTGREPRYHIGLEESPDWAYGGEALGPLKGYPGVAWVRPKRKRRTVAAPLPDEQASNSFA